jgi:hypothetical protein
MRFPSPLGPRVSFGAMLVALCLAATAAPALWYQWRSKLNGEVFCAQTSPGQGWELRDGPFKDINCTRRAKPGQQ